MSSLWSTDNKGKVKPLLMTWCAPYCKQQSFAERKKWTTLTI
jgi:hypothetical protein